MPPLLATSDEDTLASGNDEDSDDDSDDDAAPDDDDAADAGARAAGLRRSSRTGKGRTSRFDDYGLLMDARRQAHGSPCTAHIKDGFVFFSADALNDAAPIPVEDRPGYYLTTIFHRGRAQEVQGMWQSGSEKGAATDAHHVCFYPRPQG
jgi:hypothetical protein